MWPAIGADGYQELPAAGAAPLLAAAGQYAEPPAEAVLLVGPNPINALPAHLCSTCCPQHHELEGAFVYSASNLTYL